MKKCKSCQTEISKKASKCPHCQTKQGSGVVKLFFIVLLGAFIFAMVSGTSEVSSPKAKPVNHSQLALQSVKLADFTWRRIAFDSILEADFVIRNDSKYIVKDLKMECVAFAKSGTKIDHNSKIIYDIVEPHQTKSFDNFNLGFLSKQAASISCSVDGLTAGLKK